MGVECQVAVEPRSFGARSRAADVRRENRPGEGDLPRDPALRELYARTALAQIPRLLTAVDRHPLRATYGCADRQYWHYRTAAFPSGMYQEAVLPLALVYAQAWPGNRWQRQPALREWLVAMLRYALRSAHRDGSCDDYYPWERALGAAVFSLQAEARAYQLLGLDDAELVAGLVRRARWIARHRETGRLANHQALAALGLWRVFQITGQGEFQQAARRRIAEVLTWQHPEGWFEEYGGADPGYQSLTIDCLAQLDRLGAHPDLAGPLGRAVSFAREFLHPDRSYAGPYGSRGTSHCFPLGWELLAATDPLAADLADGHLAALATGRAASFDDDRLVAHRLASLLEAYHAWSPRRPASPPRPQQPRVFAGAGLVVQSTPRGQAVVAPARGGALRFERVGEAPRLEGAIVAELADGRLATSDPHDRAREWSLEPWEADADEPSSEGSGWRLRVAGRLAACRYETAGPFKQAVLHLGMLAVGRWLRTPVRWLLQRRLITGRRWLPIAHERVVEWRDDRSGRGPCLRVSDRLTLLAPGISLRRLVIVPDQQSAYVAAGQVYQAAALSGTCDLTDFVPELNKRRAVTIVRELGPPGARREPRNDIAAAPAPSPNPARSPGSALCGPAF